MRGQLRSAHLRHPWTTRTVARLLAAVATATVIATTAVSPASAAPQPTEPTFVNGEAQPVFPTSSASWINHDLWIETEVDSDLDGRRDLIHADVSRVQETETAGLKVPVILEVSPYYAGTALVATNWPVDHEIGEPPATKPPMFATARPPTAQISTSHEANWVPRGFAVMHAESLGSGQSDGCPTSGGRNETLGAKAVIDWLRGRARGWTTASREVPVTAYWSNGKAGMIGTSYNGTIPNAVATTGVEGLEAIVPISAISDWYDYYRANGAVRAPGGFQGEDLDVLADYVYSRANRLICQPVIEELRANQDRRTGDSSPFWAERNYMNDVDKVHAAVLVAHGNNDNNVMTKHAAQFYEAIKARGVPHQMYWHQGGHGGSPPLTRLNRWFTRYLWGVQNGVENDPKAWVVREGQPSSNPTPYAEWPDPAAADVRLSMSPGAPAAGALGFRKTQPATETLTDDARITVASHANAATSPNRLLFKSPVLSTPIRISGTPRISLRVAFSKPKANLTAVLVSYPATGNATIISRGWMDPENRTSISVTEPVTPGTMYQLTFDLQPKDSVVAAGRRLGIVVLSSDNEHSIRPAAGTRLSVDLGSSSVSLPVVGGARALAESFGVTRPRISHTVSPAQPNGDNGWYTTDASLAWQVDDGGAPAETTGCVDQTFAIDGTFTASCEATNAVGSADPVAVTIRRDATAPAVAVTGVEDGAEYVLGRTPPAGCDTGDATSGVAEHPSVSTSGGPVGPITATCGGARDVAGNTGTAAASYRVVYDWRGFFSPVKNPPTVNVQKPGSVVPLKFSLAGNQGLEVLAGAPSFQPTSCASGAAVGSAVGATNATPFRYDAGSDTYTYEWKTPKVRNGTCGRVDVALVDGTTHSALFRFGTA